LLKLTCLPCLWGSRRAVEHRVQKQSGAVSGTETILEFTFEDNAKSGKDLYYSRGSSACWGIPGLAAQQDGSINVIPDESNFACTASGRDYDYYQHLIVPLSYDGRWDLFRRNQVHIADVEFYGQGFNRSGTVEWEYGCTVLGNDSDPSQSPDFVVSCKERPPTHDYSLRGYTVTIERAAAVEVAV
jgi:hypothetical protein